MTLLPHPGGMWIDPLAGRSTLIGSTWVRRTPEGDDWDGPVRVLGIFEVDELIELVVGTVAFTGQPVMTADAADFARSYKREDPDDDDPAERVAARLQELAARAGA